MIQLVTIQKQLTQVTEAYSMNVKVNRARGVVKEDPSKRSIWVAMQDKMFTVFDLFAAKAV